MGSLTIERLPGGYLVTVDDERQVATGEHVATLIKRHWPDVVQRLPSASARPADRAPEQKLIDLMFHIGIAIAANQQMHRASNEIVARWIADQLRVVGYPTQPIGSCWGMLTEK